MTIKSDVLLSILLTLNDTSKSRKREKKIIPTINTKYVDEDEDAVKLLI